MEQFRTRGLEDAGPFIFVAADALVLKIREGGRVAGVDCLVTTGINADGHREEARKGPDLLRSSGNWLPAACPGSSWPPPSPTPDWCRQCRHALGAGWQRCRTRRYPETRRARPILIRRHHRPAGASRQGL